jgi:type VI secretion system protein ImpC
MSNPSQAPVAGQAAPQLDLLEQAVQDSMSRLTDRLTDADHERDQQSRVLFEVIKEVAGRGVQRTRFNASLIDEMIADIDARLSAQTDEILHHPKFQAVESAWRGLQHLVKGTDFNKNAQVALFDITKQELGDDFESAPTLRDSRLFRLAYEESYAQFGGTPVGAIIGNYDFGPSEPDMALLRRISNVASQAHAPFIAAASPSFWGEPTFGKLPQRPSVSTRVHPRWQAFRESQNANFVALTLPRFMARSPYHREGVAARTFDYSEDVTGSNEHYLWTNTAFAFGARLTASFTRTGWAANMIGVHSGGKVGELPLHRLESGKEYTPPTEITVSDPREKELSEEGFIPLVWEKDTTNAVFFSASSCQKTKFFGNNPEDKEAERNYKLGTQLPYLFMVTRLAHHIQTYQRERLGLGMSRQKMQTELETFVKQYVSDQESPQEQVMAERPFRSIGIAVQDIDGDPGWYRVQMSLRPHFKFGGMYADLSLVGTAKTNK